MGIHEGHRKRVKEKIEKTGMESFADHEVLEALLFYAIPYRDTNPIAHALIDRAGGLDKVPTLSADEIASVSGCSHRTADFLTLFSEAGRRGFIGCENSCVYDTPATMRDLAKQTVAEETNEYTYLLLFDNRFSLIDTQIVFREYYASASFRAHMVAEPALRAHASMAVLVTRHTNRIARADRYERETSRHMASALAGVGVHLLEHYIVGGNLCMPTLHPDSSRMSAPFKNTPPLAGGDPLE